MNLKESSIPMSAPGATARNETISKTTYVKFPIDKGDGNKEMSKDLHKSHFLFGTDNGLKGLPEYKAAYINQGFVPNTMNEAHAKDIRNSHIGYIFNPVHQGNVRVPIRSTYQDRISDRSGDHAPQLRPINHNLQQTNFLVGTENPNYMTEMKAKYVDPGRAQTPASDFGKRFNFDTVPGLEGGKVDYTTEAKAQYTGRKPDEDFKDVTKALAKDLRREHFVLGSEPGDKTTYYHLYYDKLGKDREAAKLNVEKLNDVKRSHFNLGSTGNIEITHYIDQHRWLQPVPKQVFEQSDRPFLKTKTQLVL